MVKTILTILIMYKILIIPAVLLKVCSLYYNDKIDEKIERLVYGIG